MTCLFLTEDDVCEMLDMPTTIAAVEEVFRHLADGKADNVPRVRAQAPGIVLHSMSAACESLGLVGWKQYTTTRNGAIFHVGLYDAISGEPVALIAADRLGQMRTGAVSGVAAKHLAAADADIVGLLGSGWQAQSQLAAIAAVRPIKRALVYSRSEERRRGFAAKMSEELGIEVVPVESARQAVEELPIVVTATSSKSPVLEGAWLAESALLCAIGSNWLQKAEVDIEAVRRSAAVVCDSIEACRREAGDFVPAILASAFQYDNAIELCDVVAGRFAGRKNPEDIVFFKSVGLAIEDVAVGGKLLELARQKETGRELTP